MDDFINEKIWSFIIHNGPKLIGAVLLLIIGLWLIKLMIRGMKLMMKKREVNPGLQSFLGSFTGILLKTLLFISVLSMIGIEVTSFIAILGAAGLAVGLALSGTLQNFAGGVLILIFKPFKAGDFIEAQGYTGTVNEILIFNTVLKTPDNKTIIIPNGPLSTSSLINYSSESTRRVDWTFCIAYGEDAGKAKEVLRKLLDADQRILKEPEPFIALGALSDSSVDFVVRAWVHTPDYWAVFFDMNEKVYKTFNEVEGLSIPFPQMDVHLHNNMPLLKK
jgi:small conductance mechanosensitive channel